MVKKENYFEGGTKSLEKSYKKSLFISKSLAEGVENNVLVINYNL